MKLHAYMKLHKLDDATMAARLGCGPAAVKKWKYGERIPRVPDALRIQTVTEGAVTPADFLPDAPAAPPEVSTAAE